MKRLLKVFSLLFILLLTRCTLQGAQKPTETYTIKYYVEGVLVESTSYEKGETPEYEVSFENSDKLNAPLQIDQVVGKAIVTNEGKIIQEIDLIVKNSIDKMSFKDCIEKVVEVW